MGETQGSVASNATRAVQDLLTIIEASKAQ